MSAAPAPLATPPYDWSSALADELPQGCFARSADAIACIASRGSTQLPQTFALEIVSRTAGAGDHRELADGDAGRAALLAALRAGRFAPIEPPVAEAHAPYGQRATLAAPALAIAWQIAQRTPVVTDEGSWDHTIEHLVATAPRACTFGELDLEGVEATSLRAWPLAGGGFAVERTLTYGLEGEVGGATDVFELAANADCPP